MKGLAGGDESLPEWDVSGELRELVGTGPGKVDGLGTTVSDIEGGYSRSVVGRLPNHMAFRC